MTAAVVLLSDGAPELVRAADALRAAGFRVLATPHVPEWERRLQGAEVVLVAAPERLLGARGCAALRVLRTGDQSRPDVYVLVQGDGAAPDYADHSSGADDVASLIRAAERAALSRGAKNGGIQKIPPPAGVPPAVEGAEQSSERDLPTGARWGEIALRLTELEDDAERFLDAMLEALIESADAESGSLLIAPADGKLEVARRADGGAFEAALEEAEAFAGKAAAAGEPMSTMIRGLYAEAIPLRAGRDVTGVAVVLRREPMSPLRAAAFAAVARQSAANHANSRKLAELREMAVIDPLTGLFNRRFFDRQLRVEIERARRLRRQVSLAIIDVDGFKRFNCFNGYHVGDQVIRETAEVLRGNFRETDVVTRWGGDEFAVILPESGRRGEGDRAPTNPAHFVDRVRRAVERRKYEACPTAGVTVSAGIAVFPVDAPDARVLFQLANQALLQAKRTGPNCVRVVGPDGQIQPPQEAPAT